MDISLDEMKIILIDALKEFHKICLENNLRYYLLGGTMLGAVRHKGFIPWDDDIDVGMPRDDYERFRKIASKKLSAVYEIEQYNNSNTHPYNYLKMIDKRTLLIQESLEHLNAESGVFIDIFPLDGVPENEIERKVHDIRIKIRKVFISYHYYSYDMINKSYWNRTGFVEKYIKKNILFMFMKIVKIITKFIDIQLIHKSLDKLLSKYKFDESEIVGNYLGAWGSREFMARKFFGNGKKIIFEDNEFIGVEDSDAYLKNLYGDYWELPPEGKRKSHHSFSLVRYRD
jgi:lipopolysaccharide cholinephosphotransferase